MEDSEDENASFRFIANEDRIPLARQLAQRVWTGYEKPVLVARVTSAMTPKLWFELSWQP